MRLKNDEDQRRLEQENEGDRKKKEKRVDSPGALVLLRCTLDGGGGREGGGI